MARVTDPDNLDRFQVIVAPIEQTISIRGTGTARQAVQTNGQTAGTTTFTRAAGDFAADGVVAGDVLCILDDPADDQGIIGHYRVVSQDTATTITVDRTITTRTGADLTWRCFAAQTTGAVAEQVADGVNGQALYSFLKEEWRVLAAGLGNAEDLNAFNFPMVFAQPTAQYILGGVNGDASSAWTFNDTNGTQTTDTEGSTRELLRDMGWQERNASDVVLREYANITTLGSLDSDAQVYYQQGDATGNPTDFKLTGAVNQPILTFGPDVGPDTVSTGFVITGTNNLARNDGGDFAVDNYRIGDYVTIRSAEDIGNNGSFGPITAITAGVNGDITIAGAGWTNNADDTTLIVQVDHRRYTKLFVRKKGRFYASAVHADAGIASGANIVAQVNAFPLSHSNDVATNIANNGLEDGVISGGDGTTVGDIFQEVETHTSGSDGVTESTPTSDPDAFTFTSAGSTFNSTARSIQILRVGDSLEITSGSDQRVFEIKSIDSATQVTLWKEPGATYTGGESTLSFTCRTGVLDVGATNATLANVDGATGTLTSAGSTFDVDTALGDRIVNTGDIVEVYAGTGAVIGYYKVVSRDSATVLTLNTSDQIFSGETSQSYRIWRPGMFLQRFETNATQVGPDGGTGFDFNDANPDTIDRNDAGDWTADGYNVPGLMLTVTLATQTTNNQSMIVASATAGVITLIGEEAVTADTGDNTAVFDGEYGITRTINSVVYPFHWRLFANGGTLQQIYQFLQRDLRRTTDIDGGNGTERGDITDSLMTFVSPNGTTLDLYPDDHATADSNNVTYQDMSGDSRNNAFLVGITYDVNNNLINSINARLVAYFTTNPAGNFGTNTAVIVQDSTPTNHDFTTISGDIQTDFDYTNNAQGGRTPDTDAGITVVAIGDDLAQHVLVTATITKVNSLVIPVGNALERNYST